MPWAQTAILIRTETDDYEAGEISLFSKYVRDRVHAKTWC